MGRRTATTHDDEPLPPPATTLEGREDQLIALATDLIERRMREGTASAQEALHFAKQGSVRAKLENEKLKAENDVLLTRIREMESRVSSEELMQEALKAFQGYSGEIPVDPDEDDYDSDLY